MEGISGSSQDYMSAKMFADNDDHPFLKCSQSSCTTFDCASDNHSHYFLSVLSSDSERISRRSTMPFIQHAASSDNSQCTTGGSSPALRLTLNIDDLPEEETITPQQTGRYFCGTAAVDETGERASCGRNFSSLLYTPQTPAYVVAMQQALDGELAMAQAEDSFEPLPPVTHLWNQQLYIGGYPDRDTILQLRSLGITHIINCCAGDMPTPSELRQQFVVKDIDTADRSDYRILFHDYRSFSETLDTILSNPDAKVFVHCIAGVNRSVVLCAAYLMAMLHLNPIQVIQIFRENGRVRVLDNMGFRHQLIDFFFEELRSDNEEERWNARGGLFVVSPMKDI
eukprot:gene6156-4435_t